MSEAIALLALLFVLLIVAALVALGYWLYNKLTKSTTVTPGQGAFSTSGKPYSELSAWEKLKNSQVGWALGGILQQLGLVGGAANSTPAPKDNTPARPDAPVPPGLESLDIFGFKPFASGGTVGDYIGNTGQSWGPVSNWLPHPNRLSWEDYLAKARAIFTGKSDKEIRELYDKSGGVL